jgi:PEP-CTERM motif
MRHCLRSFSLVFSIALLLALSVSPGTARASNLGGGVASCDVAAGELCDQFPASPTDFNTAGGDAGLNHSLKLGGETATDAGSSVSFNSVDYETPSQLNSGTPVEGTPEPSTFLLLGTGLFLAAGLIRHRMGSDQPRRANVVEVKVVEVRQKAA